jgi:gliding motility-associated-like protein
VTDSRDCLTTTDATVPERLTLTLTSDSPIILGDNARLRAITNAIEPFILWSPPDFLSCTDCATPEALQPTQSMAYQIEITDDKGCSIRDSVNLTVLLRYPAYLPNAFSPNNDGINDTWAPQGGPALERWLYLQVYDRWGGLIFEAQNPNGQNAVLDWDGRAKNQPMPVGVYTCIMEGQFIDGTVRQFQSDVLLTR